DDRTFLNAGKATASSDTELRAGMCCAESFRQLHIHDSDAGHSFDRINAANGYRHECCKIGADSIKRKCDIDIRALDWAMSGFKLWPCGARCVFQRTDFQHTRRDARLEFFRFTWNGDKSAGRLIARNL